VDLDWAEKQLLMESICGNAVLNLLDNAMKYSGDSRYVGVRLRADHGKLIVPPRDVGSHRVFE